MNEDYLWDKSGEPDPDIERLENTLGRLRFKRPIEPLPLPVARGWSFRLSFSPALAIAATLLVLILAGGLWLGLRRPNSTETRNAVAKETAPEAKPVEKTVSGPRPPLGSGNPIDAKLKEDGDRPDTIAPDAIVPRNKLPRPFSGTRQLMVRHRREVEVSPGQEPTAREGEQAKEQLILALHIASDKLSMVQKKIQASPGT